MHYQHQLFLFDHHQDDQRWNENRDVQDSFITLLATGGSEMPPLFSPPRAAE